MFFDHIFLFCRDNFYNPPSVHIYSSACLPAVTVFHGSENVQAYRLDIANCLVRCSVGGGQMIALKQTMKMPAITAF